MLGMRSEPLMSMEEMLAVLLVDAQHSSDLSLDLYEDEAECMLPDGAVACRRLAQT